MSSRLQRFNTYVKSHKLSVSLFLILMAIVSVITVYKLLIQVNVGVAYWDTFQYLNFARRFAVNSFVNDMSLSPFIPYLTSFFFRLGYVSANALFILDSIIYILGVLGFYCLLKFRFSSIESFAGSIIYATFTLILSWIAVGGIDLSSVSFSILAILFTVMAVKKDSKYYYLAFPLAAIAFFTKYTAGLIGLIILFYIFINKEYVKNLKEIVIGIIIGFLISLRFLIYFYVNLGNPVPFFGQFRGTVSNAATTIDSGFNPDYIYYLKNIPNYISSISHQNNFTGFLNPSGSDPSIVAYILLGIMVLGISIYLYNILKKMSNLNLKKEYGPLQGKMGWLKLGLFIILLTVLIITLGDVSYVLSVAIIFVLFYLIYGFLNHLDIKNSDIDVMFFLWLTVYVVFHSILATKNDRYFVTVMPGLAFLVVLGINNISSKLKFKYKNLNISSWVLSLALVFMVLSSTIVFLDRIPQENYAQDMEAMSIWLKDNDPLLYKKIVYSNHWPGFEWYMKKRIYRAIPQTKKSMFKEFGDLNEFSKFLQEKKAYYYIYRGGGLNIPDYNIIKTIGIFTLYKIDDPESLIETQPGEKPSIIL
ncbi:MAG: glycosyltransferase family 39 protein [Methanomicrobiales archaeon]